MAFQKVDRSADAVKDGGNSKYINKSGIYDVNVIAPFLDINEKGSTVVNFFVDYQDQQQPIFGNLRITNNDGSVNKIGMETFNKLCVIVGIEDEVSDAIEATLPMGKAGADKDAMVLEDLAGVDLKVRIQVEYSAYGGKIRESKVIKGFYRADGASAAEIINDTEVGVQLTKDEAYKDNITYKDGLDEDQIAVWIKGGRKGGGTSGGTTTAAANKPTFKKPSFAAKK